MTAYEQLVSRAHTHMDAALDPRLSDMAVFNARHAAMYAQNAKRRSNSAWQRGECADLIREADKVIGSLVSPDVARVHAWVFGGAR